MIKTPMSCKMRITVFLDQEVNVMSRAREGLKEKKRIVVKIGSSSLVHEETGRINIMRLEKLVRVLVDIKNEGKDVCLVSSGAIAVGKASAGMYGTKTAEAESLPMKQACAAIGQAKLVMMYQKLFGEYNSAMGQVLLTRITLDNEYTRQNAYNTFEELFKLGVIPVVNENDSISTEEIEQVQTFGDNDRLSAIVTKLTGADLLVLLSDIDGMYTDDPKDNPEAKLIPEITDISESLLHMAQGTHDGGPGRGGMSAKLAAAEIALGSGADMLILNGNDPYNIKRAMEGEPVGTLFVHKTV